MKYFLFALAGTLSLASCNNNDGWVFVDKDTTDWTYHYKTPNYDPKYPDLGGPILENELENEYQHKKQVFIDSTVCMSWSDAGFVSGNRMIKFFQNFQFLVKDRNKEGIAALIKFPLRSIQTRKEFMDSFDYIFDETVTEEVFEQNPFELYRDKNGCMAGNDGQVWFKPTGKSFQIVDINY